MTAQTQAPRRKSARLSVEDHKALNKWVKRFATIVEAAELIGISRQVLDRILAVKSGSPMNIEKVLTVLRRDDGRIE